VIVRKETQKDFDEIYNLIKAAFETAEEADGDEQDHAVKLRNGSNYIPELALVAVLNKKLIGHIMFTKTCIKGSDAACLLLSPVSVLLKHRKKGVGACLINTGLSIARDLGYKAVFLCGEPAYYKRFGFCPVKQLGIDYAMDIPGQYVLGCELKPGALRGVAGIIDIV